MKSYLWNLLLAFDHLLNAVLGGLPGQTLTERMTAAMDNGRCYLCRWTCKVLDWIDPGHCRRP